MMTQSHELNGEQLDATKHKEGPLLVLAGAGSGKTRVVTSRIAELIRSGVYPSQILAVTFTNKAAGEMKERVYNLLQDEIDLPTICTFHSLGVRILRSSIQALGRDPNFTIYDEEDSNKLLKGAMHSLNLSRESAQFKTYRSMISHCKNQMIDAHDLKHSDLPRSFKTTFPEIYSLYQERLKEANALDFDDLLFMTTKLLQESPDVLDLYQRRWPYLLIDEYQDTNKAQYTLAKLIVQKSNNIFVVGDPDQSIYTWRGASIENILNFEHDYPGAKVVRLEQNYRSRKNILDAANALVAHNNSRYEKNLWSDRGEGEKIGLFVGDGDREEAGFVVQEIERLHKLKQTPLSEIAIFYRTNFQSRIFEDFLLRRDIPYVIVGGISFYRRKEIKDVLAFLHMIISDYDTVSFARTVNLPKRGLGETTIEKLRDGASESGLPILAFIRSVLSGETSGIRLSAKQKAGLQEYSDLIEGLRVKLAEISLQELVSEMVSQSGYLEVLRSDQETFNDRKENVDELVNKAHEWELLNDSNSLSGFLEELSLRTTLDDADTATDRVNLMTLHNGKGLEFDVAFLVGMEEDLFPHINSKNNFDSLEEERRLCYVGMTRAKERLYLTASETRMLFGSYRMMRPSRFLKEIPRQYIDRYR